MPNLRLSLLLALLVLTPAASPVRPSPQDSLGEAAKFKILYAGKKGDPREKRFAAFLKERFDQVDTMDLEKLTAAAAAPYDVVVADWGRRYGRAGDLERGPKLQLGSDFSKPIVMIGAVGGEIQRHTKFDWL